MWADRRKTFSFLLKIVGGQFDWRLLLVTANGLSAVLLMRIGAIGQPLFGLLVDWFDGAANASAEQVQNAFQIFIWVMPVAFVVAIFCSIFLKETFKKG